MNIQLGQFEVNSGQLVVADPCYELDTNIIIMGVLEAVLNGTWVGKWRRWRSRIGVKPTPS